MKYLDEKRYCVTAVFTAVFLLGALASCTSAPAARVPPSITSIRVVMDNNYPPYIFLDEQGNPQGILVDQWVLWEEYTGVKVEISAIPWEDALAGMAGGNVDVIDTIFYTKERAKIYDFTDAYASIDVPIFFHNNISGIVDANDLKGFRVAVKTGDADAEYLASLGNIDLVFYDSYEDIIRAVERKEETIFVIDQPPGLYFLYKYGLQNQFNHSAPLFSGEFHRAVKKGDSTLLALVAGGFASISEAEYQAIDNRWFGTQPANLWQKYLPYLQVGTLIVFLVIVILVIFNRSLQRRVSLRTRELKQALSDLQKSERKYREIFNATTEGIIIQAVPDGELLHVNDTMLQIYGYDSEEEVLSLGIKDLSIDEPPYTEFDAQQKMHKALEEGPQVFEWLAKKRNGQTFWTEVSLRSMQTGGEDQFLAVVRDITERRQAEEALRESEKLLREAQSIAEMGSYVLDFSSGMWKSSVPLDILFGIDDTFIRSVEGWFSLIHSDHLQQMIDYLTNDVMAKRTNFDREYKIIRKNDGVERWVHGLGELEVDAQNNLIKMHGVIQDITDRKQVEQFLRDRELQYRTLVEQIPAIIYIDDVRDEIFSLYVSPQINSILGIAPEEWLHAAPGIWNTLVHPDDRELVHNKYLRCAKTGEPFEAEYRIKNASGRYLWIHDQAVMMRDENGEPQLMQGMISDITEAKQAENEMSQRVMELETLYESGLAINQIHEPGEIGQLLIELLEQKLDWHHTTIRLYHPEDESLELLAFNQPGLRNEAELPEVEQRLKTMVASSTQGISGWAVQHNQVVRSNNLRNDPHYVETYPGLQSGLYVPMKQGERVIGVISIESEQPNAFSLADERLTVTLANQAASALENARLFASERRQRQISDALRDALSAGASMSASLDFETILDRLLEALEQVVPFDGACIMLVQPDDHRINIARLRGYNKLGENNFEILKGFNFDINSVKNLHWMFDNKQPLVIPDVEQYPGWLHISETSYMRSWAGAPIIVNNEVIAFFSLDSIERNYFTNDHIELMRAFTGQASLALQNARLFDETTRRFQEFAALYETSNALSADNDLNTLLKDIVEHAATLLKAATGAMYLRDRTNDDLQIVVSTTPVISIGTTLRPGEGVAGRVAQTQRPMRIKDYSTWEGRSHVYDGLIFRAILEVPMLFGGDLIGVLNVAEMNDSNRTFTDSDERLLSLFAAQAAGALHSARLYEETARRAREFAALYETSNALSSENELNTMLQAIVERARKLLGASSGGIYLYLSETKELELTVDTTHSIPLGTRLHISEGVAGRVAQTYQPLRIDDYCTWEGRSPVFKGIPIHAVLEVPMLYGGELIGVLTAEETDNSTRKFTETDERLLSLFASLAAGAIHSARLREQTSHRLDQLQALHLIDRAISSSFDLHPILNTVISQTIAQLNVDAVDVLLFYPHLQTLDYVAGQGFRTRGIEQTHLRLGECFAGRAAFDRRTVHVPNLPETGSGFTRAAILKSEVFLEYYAVPLTAKGEVKGVLEIFNRTKLPLNPEWLDFLETLAGQAAITIDQTKLFEDLQRANIELTTAYDATIEGWARAMDLRDEETENHTRRVTELTLSLAKSLGIKDNEMLHIRRGALLHDIGKMGVPDNILLKEGELSEEEWVHMRRHPQFAYEMLQPIKYLRQSLAIPYCHHEKWDGTGYPRELSGVEIPMAARIFAIVDVWDAITSKRPYRKAWKKEKALAYIKEQSGKQFDPKVVDAFLRMTGS
jgi:PAS domain S-box-containing protein/putative nucleotidyltransferase with HDIG domain